MRFEATFEPAAATLDLWFIDLAREPSEAEWGLLAEDERERATRLLLASKRRQAVRARAALRQVLGGYLARDPAGLRFGYGEHGKPTLVAGGPTFNLSHSHAIGLLGVVLEPIELGVDIEHARAGRAFDAIAEHFFAPDEASWFAAQPEPASVAAFYRIWTHKEAYLKALGTGLSFGSRGFSLALPDGDPADRAGPAIGLRSTNWPGDDAGRWRFASLACPRGYAAAACWAGSPVQIRQFVAPGSEADSLLAAR